MKLDFSDFVFEKKKQASKSWILIGQKNSAVVSDKGTMGDEMGKKGQNPQQLFNSPFS